MEPDDELAEQEWLDELQAADGLEPYVVLPPEPCLACHHPKFLHCGEGEGCQARNDPSNAFSNVPGFGCWCPSFTHDPEQASAQILAHGDRDALQRGTTEALGRQDSEYAQRLVSGYIHKTPEGERDRAWVDDVTRQISALRSASNEFRREGDTYTLSFEGKTCRLKHLVGLDYISMLLRDPGRSMRVQAMRAATARPSPYSKCDQKEAMGNAVPQLEFSTQDQLDSKTRREYKAQIKQLDIEIAHAEAMGKQALLDEKRTLRTLIDEELSRGKRLRGKPRKFSGASEKARFAVTNAIRFAIDKITHRHAALGKHLNTNISTGATPVYRDCTIKWTF